MKKISLLLLTLLLVATVFAGCSGNDAAKDGNTLKIGVSGEY